MSNSNNGQDILKIDYIGRRCNVPDLAHFNTFTTLFVNHRLSRENRLVRLIEEVVLHGNPSTSDWVEARGMFVYDDRTETTWPGPKLINANIVWATEDSNPLYKSQTHPTNATTNATGLIVYMLLSKMWTSRSMAERT